MKVPYFLILMALVLSGCGTFEVSVQQTEPAAPPVTLPATAVPSSPQPASRPVFVAYVKEGSIQLWDEAANETRSVFISGDVVRVTMSPDGQVIAFLRRTLIEKPELLEKLSLWAVERDGRNPRQLIAADELHQRLAASDTDSSNIDQLEWIPGTHRLAYTADKYYLPGQGIVFSGDVYAVDADSGADSVLVSGVTSEGYDAFLVIPSPDGKQLALLSNTVLSFANTDGSDFRPSVLTYETFSRGDSQNVMVRGVWTQDSRSFLVTAPTSIDPYNDINFTIMRVPADGSVPEALASASKSHPGSVTFSPDGRRFAYVQYGGDGTLAPLGWFITPLPEGVGPLAVPYSMDFTGYANIHWSPASQAFTGKMLQLCPDATRDTDVCDAPLDFSGGELDSLRWLDGNRLLYMVRDAPVLYLASLDGRAAPVVTWS
ncbi:MAG TPA: hypothetical protein VIU39_09225, partial [Anaerolineales bacterium]